MSKQKTDARQAMASYLCNMFYAHESGEPDQYLDMADDLLSIAAGAPHQREECRPRTGTTDLHVAFGRPATVNDPTPAMIDAGVKALRYYLDNPRTPMGQVVIDIYRAMEDARAG